MVPQIRHTAIHANNPSRRSRGELLVIEESEGATTQPRAAEAAFFALLSLLYSIPMLCALWLYAFRSPQLWNSVPRPI